MEVRLRTFSARELRRPYGTGRQTEDDIPFVEIIGSLQTEQGDDLSGDQNRQTSHQQNSATDTSADAQAGVRRSVAAQLAQLQRALDEGRSAEAEPDSASTVEDPENPLGKRIDLTA